MESHLAGIPIISLNPSTNQNKGMIIITPDDNVGFHSSSNNTTNGGRGGVGEGQFHQHLISNGGSSYLPLSSSGILVHGLSNNYISSRQYANEHGTLSETVVLNTQEEEDLQTSMNNGTGPNVQGQFIVNINGGYYVTTSSSHANSLRRQTQEEKEEGIPSPLLPHINHLSTPVVNNGQHTPMGNVTDQIYISNGNGLSEQLVMVPTVMSPIYSQMSYPTTNSSTNTINNNGITNPLISVVNPLTGSPDPDMILVNPKQFNRILIRRDARAKLEQKYKIISRQPYLHNSRHDHATKRMRGPGGRFLSQQERKKKKRKTTGGGGGRGGRKRSSANTEDEDEVNNNIEVADNNNNNNNNNNDMEGITGVEEDSSSFSNNNTNHDVQNFEQYQNVQLVPVVVDGIKIEKGMEPHIHLNNDDLEAMRNGWFS